MNWLSCVEAGRHVPGCRCDDDEQKRCDACKKVGPLIPTVMGLGTIRIPGRIYMFCKSCNTKTGNEESPPSFVKPYARLDYRPFKLEKRK